MCKAEVGQGKVRASLGEQIPQVGPWIVHQVDNCNSDNLLRLHDIHVGVEAETIQIQNILQKTCFIWTTSFANFPNGTVTES